MIMIVVLGLYALLDFFREDGQIEKIEKIKELTKFGRSWTGANSESNPLCSGWVDKLIVIID